MQNHAYLKCKVNKTFDLSPVLNFEFSPTERDLSAARLKVYMTQIILFVSLEYAFSAHILPTA